jgi:hypothetical protein
MGQHQEFSNRFLESPNKIGSEILPQPEQVSVNFQVIDKEFIFVQNADAFDQKGGIAIQDRELVQELIAYFERKCSAKCPEAMRGSENVAKWFEERFEVKCHR